MRICIISKYPPIEGGVSSETYWLAKALGERGHEISIVTNAWEVEADYRAEMVKEDLPLLEPKNVHLYSTRKDFRSPILKSHYYTEKLINLAVDIIKGKDVDVIHSHYILPYGIAGFVAKQITKRPHVLRHAGSDTGRLYYSKFLKTIFTEALRDADKVIGGNNIFEIFKEGGINPNKIFGSNFCINPQYFNPHGESFDFSPYIQKLEGPVFSYFGKVSRLKKTYAFVDAASKIKKKKFTLLFVVGDGVQVQELKKYVTNIGLKDKCVFLPFQPPWKIPAIMRASTCIVSPESEETPFLKKGAHYPKIVREAMNCGKCAIMGEGVAKKGLYNDLIDKENILIIDPHDINEFKNKLELVIDNPTVAEDIGQKAYKFSRKNEDFEGYVKHIESIMSSVKS